jgi:hypothetical protein
MSDATSPPGRQGTERQDESQAREKAQEVAGQAQELAGQAQEKAQEAAGQASGMVREQVDQRSTEAGERVSGTARDLRSVGEELRNQGKERPAKYAEQGAERIERIGSYLSESDADKLLSDVEDFGRRAPLAVLAGGLVVGIAAARFLKASSRDRYRGRSALEGPTGEPAPSRSVADVPAEPIAAPVQTPRETPVPTAPAMGR